MNASDSSALSYSELYPMGVTTQFPIIVGPNNTILSNTAHRYIECSNRGLCDRKTGVCSCYTGYEGGACQRNNCPQVNNLICNGRGTCENARTFARRDNLNIYELWDSESNMGCYCDYGFAGAACTELLCKSGFDPLYFDTDSTGLLHSSRRYSNWTIVIASKYGSTITGSYSIQFYDAFGQPWRTGDISIDATCDIITQALETLPNSIIPAQSVLCVKWSYFFSSEHMNNENIGFRTTRDIYSGLKYTLAFPSNPGKLKQPHLLIHTTHRYRSYPTLYTDEVTTNSSLKLLIYPNGFSGETVEYFTHKCDEVEVSILNSGSYDYLGHLTGLEFRLLARCLGNAGEC